MRGFSLFLAGILVFISGAVLARGQEPDFQSREAQRAWARFSQATGAAEIRYLTQQQEAAKLYLASLEESLKATMERGDLKEANRIKAEADVVKAGLEAGKVVSAKSFIKKLRGKWLGYWHTSKGGPALTIDPQGIASGPSGRALGTVQLIGGRILIINRVGGQHFELILRGNKLVILGWTQSKGFDPFKTPPDQVTIASRVGNDR